ncbi:TerB family tellurite resistance protein [uncultured Litoreibacter sp.]|uniref:tellurite resistance TerB family protein n=1 Tax=uncultured Litoreibacter sp. TaxID=1392394 RepID=UPI00263976D0|nr:TerB family tellurite resistance protein [uncultured Litoreibacter sp.]
MFDQLRALFSSASDYHTPLPESDARHAVGTLMVRAAKADKAYLFEEIELIDKILAKRNDLDVVEAAKMRASCERLEEEMPATEELATILKGAISTEEKEATLRALWHVVFADGVETEEEDQVLHEIEAVLGVSPKRAKQLHDEVMATDMGKPRSG